MSVNDQPPAGMSFDQYAQLKEREYQQLQAELDRKYGLDSKDLSQRLQIARLQSGNARASTAAQFKAEKMRIAQAQDEMRSIGIPEMLIKKFTAEKNYEIAKQTLALDIAKTDAQMRSTPDSYFQRAQFESALPGLLANDGSYGAAPTGTPQPQSLETLLATLRQGSTPAATTAATVPGVSGQMAADAAPSPTAAAASALVSANPPSSTPGLNPQDQAVLNGIGALYKQGLYRGGPGSQENLNPDQLGIQRSGGSFLGYNPATEEYKYKQTRAAQGSALAA